MTVQANIEPDTQAALRQLILDELIDRELENVVHAAHQVMQAAVPNLKDDFGRKQLNNLAAVAGETNSMAVVQDFIRYQMGREKSWRDGKPSLGAAVLDEIAKLRKRAGELVRETTRKASVSPQDEAGEVRQVWSILVRRFIAYLEHSFFYEKAGKQ